VVTIRTTSLTCNNSTFCPHSVYMCFMWISEQTSIISLYNINWLVFIAETESVYCAVRTRYLNIIHVTSRQPACFFSSSPWNPMYPISVSSHIPTLEFHKQPLDGGRWHYTEYSFMEAHICIYISLYIYTYAHTYMHTYEACSKRDRTF